MSYYNNTDSYATIATLKQALLQRAVNNLPKDLADHFNFIADRLLHLQSYLNDGTKKTVIKSECTTLHMELQRFKTTANEFCVPKIVLDYVVDTQDTLMQIRSFEYNGR